MSDQESARKAYQFFRQCYEQNKPFTIEDLMQATGLKESSVKTYLNKQWREIVKRQPNGQISVLPEIQRLSEETFLQNATQKRYIFGNYQRVKYGEIVTYEFLLPLTREDRLRKALDDLFYMDTIRQRLQEVGLDTLAKFIPQHTDEDENDYLKRVCTIISDKFGGYSIGHVSGRYKAAALTDRAGAARMLADDERYIIDETTAAVRFIIPVEATMVNDPARIHEISADELDTATLTEISLIHWLFFNLFVESIVRMIKEEDEIWLVEEAGRSRSLYTWRRA